MKRQIFVIFFSVQLVLVSCKVSPEPINYGSDVCHYCSMTIVDNQHAAEYVTKKGRAYKFDSIECMMNDLRELDKAEIGLYLVNDYSAPGDLIDATLANYLISKNIPSPMGEFLSAFGNLENAKFVQSEQGGQLFSWEALKERF
ncbi:nitrous oxide reductase accessory protein NosL [Flavobacteriaceae bacterium F89]|uniref:Nitrous oxide reductase accessory protein NosL n=1 Tax=Cerina litoralis TaxID=2874477 RepID=A0AAE3EWV4_9FLAO|nr:nitrous oxide reductase accessory protein NosL [Cerina litoralis]MCG2462353.1 nitrous oxide reductase accessory protein NosL [Cerina litoralis]